MLLVQELEVCQNAKAALEKQVDRMRQERSQEQGDHGQLLTEKEMEIEQLTVIAAVFGDKISVISAVDFYNVVFVANRKRRSECLGIMRVNWLVSFPTSRYVGPVAPFLKAAICL